MDRSVGSSKEYTVRLLKEPSTRTHIMRFPNPGGLDLSKLENPRLERQIPVGVIQEDTAPEFGAGSEYGRKQREEARRRKRGYYRRIPSAQDFPWLLRSGKKKDKNKYTGRKEGGVQQSASYYLFREVDEDTFEATPVDSWYNFTPNVAYDTLTAEEAEEQFEKRHKTLNYHVVMMKKRLQGSAEGEETQMASEPVAGARPVKTAMGDGLQVREDEEWMQSDSDSAGSGEEGKPKQTQQKQKAGRSKKKSKAKDSDDSEHGDEESDDPDVEQSREVDYMSDGSSEDDTTGGYAADEEPKLAKKKEQGEEGGESDSHSEIGSSDEDSSEDDLTKSGRETKKLLNKGRGSDASSDEDEEDYDQLASSKIAQSKNGDTKSSGKPGRDSPTVAQLAGSRSASPAPGAKTKGMFKGKSKTGAGTGDEPASKKKKLLPPAGLPATASPVPAASVAAQFKSAPGKDDVVTEEAVRRYLSRKPMTTKDLLKKFKGKTSMDGEQLVTVLGELLRKINPDRTKVRDKTLLSIKA